MVLFILALQLNWSFKKQMTGQSQKGNSKANVSSLRSMSYSKSMKDHPCIVQNTRSLDPVLMARFPEVSSHRFTKLADILFPLNKIHEIRSRWCVSDRFVVWKVPCWPFGSYQDYLYYISWTEFYRKGFSISKEVNGCNMLEEPLICQQAVYDARKACGKEAYETEID